MKATSNRQSNITLAFGPSLSGKQTPVNIELTVDIFSKKHENVKFNLQQMIGLTIEESSIVLELTANSGFGSDLADKIFTYIKKDHKYQQLNAIQGLSIKAVGKGEKAYIIIRSLTYEESLKPISEELKKHKNSATNQSNEILLQIKSLNNFSEMRKLLDNQGIMRAMLDSLFLNFTFKKTEVIELVLKSLLDQMTPGASNIVKSFDHLNLQMDFESSVAFDCFEKLRAFTMVMNKKEVQIFKALKSQYQDKAKIYFFNESVSCAGHMVGEGLQDLLEALFE